MADEAYRKDFGSRLKSLRKDRGWTQKEFSAQLGIRYQQLNKYEGGFNMPAVEMLIVMSRVLGVTIDTLLTGELPDDQPITNTQLLDRFRALDTFPSDDQNAVIRLIDGLVIKNRVEKSLTNPYQTA
jgi:transcriptional regulator with XRE-family HTH domain